jgi:hypothetical protein
LIYWKKLQEDLVRRDENYLCVFDNKTNEIICRVPIQLTDGHEGMQMLMKADIDYNKGK